MMLMKAAVEMVTKPSEAANAELRRAERVGHGSVGGCSNNSVKASVEAVRSAVDIDAVRARASTGLPDDARPGTWKLLLGLVDSDDVLACEGLTERRAQYHRWRREFQSSHAGIDNPEQGEADKKDSYARDASLIKEIDKDVCRTRCDLAFFAPGSMQQQWMLRILFVYAKLNPDLGYMQGMNEILAPIVYTFGAVSDDDSAREAEADSFLAFSVVMNSAKVLYSMLPSDPTKTGVEAQMNRLNTLLRQHDASLWLHLNSIGLSPDFYSFRWYMTLLAREFSIETTQRIWDSLLSDPRRFSFLHYISCALIISQKVKLLSEGFTGALKALQVLEEIDIEDVLAHAQQMRERDRQADQNQHLLDRTKMTMANPHVVLYFDVNKTVIMHDPVQGKDLPNIVNDLLTERAFGVVSADGETWTWNKCPVLASDGVVGSGEVSYGTFLRAKYPMSSNSDESKKNKKVRKVMRQDFTSKGFPGEGLASEHAVLLERLQLPSHDGEAYQEALAATGLDESPYHFIIPAFFHFIQYLHDGGVSFNLVFRTYGDDLHRIAQEFNHFCEGKHPFFKTGSSLMDGSDGGVDRRLCLSTADGSSHRFGTFYRSDDITALIMGTFKQPPAVNVSHEEFYATHSNLHTIHGLESIHSFLTKQWRNDQVTLAIRDFYPYWFSKREDARAGKLMTLDTSDKDVHVIFFDDNILAYEPHIVDAREAKDGTPLAWEVTRDVQLMRVEPLEAIGNKSYFIERYLLSCENHNKST
ncbi:hypothetical protein Poli38472_013798 [Pythium oligandrum]|uniref:Rab-GAP TBC domain-containing protein n=1 Tax=Pythium oligandrum TaxID=41045 RepID=A0A8K1FAG5_PYTOL|nr:hypothetical protein Poli38472_013798 [Pythium oligandrum]|eukprot:TMW55036.1 hypothetical protein Poli38472_013798 [Pythium oligandrum]